MLPFGKEKPRESIDAYIRATQKRPGEPPLSRQAAHAVRASCVSLASGDWLGPQLLWRRTKATLIYRRTGNLRAVQLLLGHRKIESTVRYLGIEVDDALAIAGQVDA